MTRTAPVARARPVFTITTVGTSLAPARECAPVRLITKHEQQPLAVASPQVTRHRSHVVWLVGAGVVLDIVVLGWAGLAVGRSELGGAIMAGLVALVVIVAVVLLLVGGGHAVHCPGCPR